MSRYHAQLTALLLGCCLVVTGILAAPLPEALNAVSATALPTDPDAEALPAGAVARLGSLRFRHGVNVGAVAISPDGKVVASGGSTIYRQVGRHGWAGTSENLIRIWNAADGQLLREIVAPRGAATCLAFSPDGKTLVAGCGKDLCSWNLVNRKPEPLVFAQNAYVSSVQFRADGEKLAARFGDGTIVLCEARTGKRLREWHPWPGEQPFLPNKYPRENCTWSELSADGTVLVFLYSSWEMSEQGGGVTSMGTRLRVYDAASGVQIGRTELLEVVNGQMDLAPDGRTLAVAGSRVQLWDLATRTNPLELGRLHEGVTALRFAPDGKTLAQVNDYGHNLRLWDTATGKELYRLAPTRNDNFPFYDGSGTLAFSANGTKLVAAFAGRVRVWDAASGEETPRFPGHRAGVGSLHFSPDDRTLTSWCGTTSCRWDTANCKESSRIEPFALASPKRDRVLDVGANGKAYLSQAEDGRPELRDLATGKLRRTLATDERPVERGLLSANGQRLVLLKNVPDAPNKYEAHFHEVRTGKRIGLLELAHWPREFTLSPDGSIGAWIGQDGRLNVADVASGKVTYQMGNEDATRSRAEVHLAFSVGGDFLAWSAGPPDEVAEPTDSSCPVHVFRLKMGKEIGSWTIRATEWGNDEVAAMALSPDGRLLATGQQGEATVRVWEVVSGQERRRFEGHKGQVYSVAFSPHGARLASGSKDGTILVWDLHGRAQAKPTDADLTAAWDDLAAADGTPAGVAVDTLVRAADRAVTLLAARLQPVAAAEPARVAGLIADLDSNEFVRRERATAELEALEGPVAPALRAAQRGEPSAEARRRLEAVLARLTTDEAVPTGVGLRRLRALEVLERINNPSARKLLKKLGEGAPTARSTCEAQAALARLAACGVATSAKPQAASPNTSS